MSSEYEIDMQTATEKERLGPQQLQQENSANIMLQPLKPIEMHNITKIQICQDNMIGDGFCFSIVLQHTPIYPI